jgi:hypothetical protein
MLHVARIALCKLSKAFDVRNKGNNIVPRGNNDAIERLCPPIVAEIICFAKREIPLVASLFDPFDRGIVSHKIFVRADNILDVLLYHTMVSKRRVFSVSLY